MHIGNWFKSVFLAGCFLVMAISPVFGYQVNNFKSEILIDRDTSLRIVEQLEVVFEYPQHGIVRTIPVIYRTATKNVNSRISNISVTNEQGTKYPYSLSRSGNFLDIKIGDPDQTVSGLKVYLISYTAKNILQRYDGYDELYWNVAGSDWDTDINSVSAVVVSPYASVVSSDCFGNCQVTKTDDNTWKIVSNRPVTPGSDVTFVLGFTPQNDLIFPDPGLIYWQDEGMWIALLFLPALIMAVAWWWRGRDDKFIGSNVYYQEAGAVTNKAGPFTREHLPLVYSPIKGLTPSEAGTILDMRVDLSDVVAEISEIARLGFISIHKIKVKRPLSPDWDDYIFIRTSKSDITKLKTHQQFLLDSLFKSSYRPSPSTLEKSVDEAVKVASKSQASQLSKMSGHFYTDLNAFQEKLYSNLTTEKIFGGRPDHLQGGGIAVALILSFIFSLIANMGSLSQLIWPWGLLSGAIAVFFGFSMGYRTAHGHALYRQLTGLKYFVGKGKWRYEIAEKNLFIEEILPLAISLGVVNKLSKDMKSLQIEPPRYLGNMTYIDFGRFGSSAGKVLASTPSRSSSGWSGGSGFSGGSMGGGFGGGGGRSW